MRTIQPTIAEIGTYTVRGQDYHCQRLMYGAKHTVLVLRKTLVHKHGHTFTGQRACDAWVMQQKHNVA